MNARMATITATKIGRKKLLPAGLTSLLLEEEEGVEEEEEEEAEDEGCDF